MLLSPCIRLRAGLQAPPSESRSSHDHSFRPLTIVVATDLNNGIGIRNTLPWHLPEDLAHFKHLGACHPDGPQDLRIDRPPLPNRATSSSPAMPTGNRGVETAASLQDAAALAQGAPAFIIGGAQIYAEALPLVDRLIITRIAGSFDCDAFFPAMDEPFGRRRRASNTTPKLPDWTTLL
jgi:dihydrofolate reductase